MLEQEPSIAACACSVSPKLLLSESLRQSTQQVNTIPLTPVNCSFGIVTERGKPRPLDSVLRKEAKRNKATVSIVFAVRRPGCSSCREHGQQLSEFATRFKKVALWGIIKETAVDDIGLLEFYDSYFHHSIYKDDKWQIYNAMGARRISIKDLLKGFFRSRSRHQAKNIKSTLAGEGWLKGGVLIFDRTGKLRYAYEETYGEELKLQDLEDAIRTLQDEGSEELSESSSASSQQC